MDREGTRASDSLSERAVYVSCLHRILGSDIARFGVIRLDATNGIFSIGAENAAE